jgi:hypothetical protein
MFQIDRAVAIIKPKPPFLDWLMQLPDPPKNLTLDELRTDCTAILIPEFDYPDDSYAFVQKLSQQIFELELDSWYRDRAWWPTKRDDQTFRAWFDVEIHSMVLATLDRKINTSKL